MASKAPCLDAAFTRVFLIAMNPESDRVKRKVRALANYGLTSKVEVVKGFPGRRFKRPGWWPNAGMGSFGCYTTHLELILRMAREEWETCLILEEDVVFQPDAPRLFREAMKQLPDDWAQFYIGGQHRQPGRVIPGRPAILHARSVHRTHAYAVHKRGLGDIIPHLLDRKLFEEHKAQGKSLHVDHLLELAHRVDRWKCYSTSWWLAGQGNNHSTIRGKQVPDAWWQPVVDDQWMKAPVVIGDTDGSEAWDVRKLAIPLDQTTDPERFLALLDIARKDAFCNQLVAVLPSSTPSFLLERLTRARRVTILPIEQVRGSRDIACPHLWPTFNHPWLAPLKRHDMKLKAPTPPPPRTPSPDGTPVFIFSTPRSGSTLLVRAFNAMPGASFAGERNGLLWKVKELHEMRAQLLAASPKAFDSIETQIEDKHFPSHFAPSTPEGWNEATRALLRAWAGPTDGTKLWGMKDVHVAKGGADYGFMVWTWIMEVMPDAKFVFLSRPVDEVEVSMGRKLSWWVPAYGSCIGNCRKRVMTQTAAFDQFASLYPDRCARITYADLLDHAKVSAEMERAGIAFPEPDAYAEVLKVKLR